MHKVAFQKVFLCISQKDKMTGVIKNAFYSFQVEEEAELELCAVIVLRRYIFKYGKLSVSKQTCNFLKQI